MEMTATLQPPRKSDVLPVHEYDTTLPSAGLPSLGKRR